MAIFKKKVAGGAGTGRTHKGTPVGPAFGHVVALICSLSPETLGAVLDSAEKLPLVDPDGEPLRRRRLEAVRRAL